MSAMPAERVRDPEELYAPRDIDDEQIQHLLTHHLTDESRVKFLAELLRAFRQAKVEGDLGHINRVVEAWTRTVLVQNEGFDAKWQRAQADAKDSSAPVLSLDDVRAKLKLDE